MTEQLVTAIDKAITVVAARYDHVLDLLLAEHDRLEQLAAMRATAEQLATSSPPALPAAAEPDAPHAGKDADDSSASSVVSTAGTGPGAATSAGPGSLDDSTRRAPAPPQPPARTPAPRAGGTGRDGLTEKQQTILTAVNALGECSVADVAARVGREDAPDAVRASLVQLRGRGLIGHNGKLARAGRYLRLGGGRPDDHPQRRQGRTGGPPIAPAAGLTGSIEQRVELALKWAKTPLTLAAIVTRCKATGERSRVQEALAYMEADGRAACDPAGRWTKTERLAEAA